MKKALETLYQKVYLTGEAFVTILSNFIYFQFASILFLICSYLSRMETGVLLTRRGKIYLEEVNINKQELDQRPPQL